jgi:two-component system phosphate regulon sensor histidine kinase PhoR
MLVNKSVYSLYLKLIFAFIIGCLFGYWSTLLWPMFFACSLIIIAWHYKQLFKLAHWLWHSKAISPPESCGLWGQVFDGLNKKIRKQRKRQKELTDQIRQYRNGAEALPDAAVILSANFVILWANTKALELIGIRYPSDVGQRIDNLIRFPEFVDYLFEKNYQQPCSIPSIITSDIQLEMRLMPYGSEQFLLLARDISNIYRMENMRRDFVANVSHELKTPLTVVRGYIEMFEISTDEFEPRWKKAFGTMKGQIARMDKLVEQLLQLSHVESTQDNKAFNIIAMPTLISTLVDDCQWLNKSKKHHIVCYIDKKLGILGYESELKSACANLITNAINYTAEGGEITISWQQVNNQAVFSVTDNGVGIKAEHINRLTERFYRVDASRSRNTGGSGLGLAIVKHVLQRHQATLNITSEWGKGSTFTITFSQQPIVLP